MMHIDQIEYARQQTLVAALLDGSRFPYKSHEVEIIETHISWVLIVGEYAYKIKKALNLGFLDFTNLETRKFFCEEEIRLNRRLAPEIYLNVISIGGRPDTPIVDSHPAIEYAVLMRSFKQESLLANLIERDEVSPLLINKLAVSLAKFHAGLPSAEPESGFGDTKYIYDSVTENIEQLLAFLPDNFDKNLIGKIKSSTEIEFSLCKNKIHGRHIQGFTRECHGDLHIGNIVLIEDRLVPFDGIEFSPSLRWIDVMDEIAFLVMDLLSVKRPDLAFRFLNSYLETTGDYAGIYVLRFFIAYRAEVRAKVFALRALQQNEFNLIQEQSFTTCQRYLALATDTLKHPHPVLVITHGLPGTGKTTLSQVAIERLQAIRLRSDVERKRLFGVNALNKDSIKNGNGIYSSEFSALTYQHLYQLARNILTAGYPVIVDATFLKQSYREQFQQLAIDMKVPFAIMAVSAPTAVMESRILLRKNKFNDASEADISVLELLKETQETLLPHELVRTVEFFNDLESTKSINTQHWIQLEKLLVA